MSLRASLKYLAFCLGLSLLAAEATAQTGTSRLRGLATENDALAWQAVGRLDSRIGFCTATLIAPDLLLTAAHCVYGPSGVALPPDDFTFQAGLTDGAAAARRGIAQIEIAKGYDPAAGLNAENVRHDLALLRLKEPISTFEIAPFSVFPGALPSGTVSVVSYGRGRAANLSRQNSCQVVQNQQDILIMDCDATFGSSGAPIFTHLNGRGQIVSVMSAIGQQGGKKYSYGMTLPRVVDGLKRQMQANQPRPAARIRRLEQGEGRGGTGAKFVTAKGS